MARLVLMFIAAVALSISAIAAQQTAREQNLAEHGAFAERLKTQSDRIAHLEEKREAFQLSVEARLTRLETLTENNSRLLTGIFIAVAMMVIEAAVRIFGQRIKIPSP